MDIYKACALCTLLHGSESWTLYARQEAKLNALQFCCLKRILSTSWQDRILNKKILKEAKTENMFSLLKERGLRWLGHVRRMKDGRLPKDILYSELADGNKAIDRPLLRSKKVCKHYLKTCGIDMANWEVLVYATNRFFWQI